MMYQSSVRIFITIIAMFALSACGGGSDSSNSGSGSSSSSSYFSSFSSAGSSASLSSGFSSSVANGGSASSTQSSSSALLGSSSSSSSSGNSSNYMVTTLAGYGSFGYLDGSGVTARFNLPTGVAVDSAGFVYVADQSNHVIRKITASGVVTTVAGSGNAGFAGGTGTAAAFRNPSGVAVDGSGNLYVADSDNNCIRKITTDRVVTVLAGSGIAGYLDGTGRAASFRYPTGVAVDIGGNVYVADSLNGRIRKITAEGVVTTLAGSGAYGNIDGTGVSAAFHWPTGVAVDSLGNVYVADRGNHSIRKITASGVVTTLLSGLVTGELSNPTGVALDNLGNIYVADNLNNRIRKITVIGSVITLAGLGNQSYGYLDGIGTSAMFSWPQGVAVDRVGNVYVADTGNYAIRKITAVP